VLPYRCKLAAIAFERTRMPMVISDAQLPDNPIVLANQAFLDLTGYSSEEVLGRNCRFLQGPDTDPEAVDAIREGIAANDHSIRVELLNYRKDGASFWNGLSISPVHDDEGRTIYYFAAQEDLTAQRRAEELATIERLLLMEVDHRTLNALAQVQSIISLTPRDSVTQYSASVRRRVDAIARVHHILATSSWAGTRLDQLLAEELPAAGVDLDGPPVTLSPKLAQPIAAVFHELIANAKQHGALRSEQGRVRINWHVTPSQLVVHWQEQSPGACTHKPEPKLGLNLMRAVVERQLGGKATLVWGEQGLDARMAVPVAPEDVRLH
jgi:PAS domain S-box-containing protein